MYSYTELQSKFNHGSINRTEYKLENNTYTWKINSRFDIVLHGSIIAKIYQDKIILDSNGWYTHTTKDRLNKILSDNNTSYYIYQEHYNWYVWGNYKGTYPTIDYKEKRIEFYNGITFIYETSPLMGVGWRLDTE